MRNTPYLGGPAETKSTLWATDKPILSTRRVSRGSIISSTPNASAVRQEHAVLPILLVTAYADIREAVGAMRDGAVNYLAKPIDLEELLATVQQVTGIAESTPLKFSPEKPLPAYVIARSPLMQAVFRDAALFSGLAHHETGDILQVKKRCAGLIAELNELRRFHRTL